MLWHTCIFPENKSLIDSKREESINMIEMFLATFLFCAVWILSVYITQKICDMDPEIRAINTRVLTVKILDYIECDDYNKAKVDIDTVEY